MKQLQPVIWSKGTFLTPQHLQVQDRFIEDTLKFHVDALSFRHWGFSELQVDQKALTEGLLTVSNASGIFPDGLLFDVPTSDAAPASRALQECFGAEESEIDVYLSVPEYRDRGVNVSFERRDAATRYSVEVKVLRNENTGTMERPVQLARKNLRLLMGNENREGSSTLRIARVQKIPTGTFKLAPAFVAPMIDLHGSEYLVSILRRLIEILVARSAELGGQRRQKNQSLADFTSTDIANFWLLYTVNSHLPVLRHLFESKLGHPEDLFACMLEIAGSLTTFSTKIHPRDLPRYEHDDLGGCFSRLDQQLRSLLETVVPTNVVSLPLKQIRPSIYAAAIDDDRYLANTRMYLAVTAEGNEGELINRVPHRQAALPSSSAWKDWTMSNCN